MKKIGPKDSRPELFVRKLVFSMGYRYRLHRKDLPGKPDMAFQKYKKVVFIHGCFWHQHKNCKRSALPATNRKFWKEKLGKSAIRDKQNCKKLKKVGWDYLVIWQCELKKENVLLLKEKISKFF